MKCMYLYFLSVAERHALPAAGSQSEARAEAGGGRVPGKGTGYPAPSPQTRTSAINASGSSVATSLRQWRTTQATPRVAHHCADPGPTRGLLCNALELHGYGW